MIEVIEDTKNEFKEILNDDLEKEVISFLNKSGGNLYIGVADDRTIVGVNDNIDKIQLKIKDRIINNIRPSTVGTFDIDVECIEGKNVIHISIANGAEKPYYLRSKGMIPDGCFIRIGNAVGILNENDIEEMYATRIRCSLKNIVSPIQQLTFKNLRMFYELANHEIGENFETQLELKTKNNKYNYLAYLLADNNNVSIQVATYEGDDVYDLIENEDYGGCCLIQATNKILMKFEIQNKNYTKLTIRDRKEQWMVDPMALKEAIINALVHNAWERESSPKFEIFSNHISISSVGGLPFNMTEEDFFKGLSIPRNPELMRVFRDVNLVEQLGTGIRRILSKYSKDIYEIYPNFIRVNFQYKYLNPKKIKDAIFLKDSNDIKFNKVQKDILNLINGNPRITQKEMVESLGIGRATVTRNIKTLVDCNVIERVGANKNGEWRILI